MTTAIGSPGPAQGQLVFAWGGVVVFALSASYFLFSLFVTFAHPLPDGPRLGPALTNLLAYAAFALHHSLFAREGVRAWVRHTVAPGAERAVYVWTASLLLALLCRVWVDVPGLLWDVPGHARWAFRAVQVGGALLLWRSVRRIDALGLVGIRQLVSRDSPASVLAPLQVGGPYRFIRHPMHAGVLLVIGVLPTMTLTQATFAAASAAYVLAAIPFEERSLRRSAPAAYDRYAQQVRWRLLPLIY
jgi:protein-S-isoprenylcysteine O-methyltransferase Ste14